MNQESVKESKTDRSLSLVPLVIGVAFTGLTAYYMARADPTFPNLNLFLVVPILVYAATIPLIGEMIYRDYLYLLVLPCPYIGSWFLSRVFWSFFNMPTILVGLLASIVSVSLVTPVHVSSRARNLLWSSPLASFSKISIKIMSMFFLLVGLFALTQVGSTGIVADPMFEIYIRSLVYVTVLIAYVTFSMLMVNTTWRERLLCKIVGNKRYWDRLAEILDDALVKKFPSEPDNLKVLGYCISDAVISFEEGDYEPSFLSAYKAIRERSVVDPTEYVTDKRDRTSASSVMKMDLNNRIQPPQVSNDIDEEPRSFSDIRTALTHFRRGHKPIKTERVERIRRNLPQYCLEILERCFVFLERVVRDERLDAEKSEGFEQPPSKNRDLLDEI